MAVIHRFQCAAISNGCMSALVTEDNPNMTWDDFLKLNGWWLDHGRWVCGNHEPKTKEAQPE